MVERLNNRTQYEYYHNYTNMMLYPADVTDKRNDISELRIIVSITTTLVVRLRFLFVHNFYYGSINDYDLRIIFYSYNLIIKDVQTKKLFF